MAGLFIMVTGTLILKYFHKGEEGFKGFIDKIHEAGLKVWLWWVPGYIDSLSPLASQQPDWLIKNKDGSNHSSYGLCPAYNPVQQYYAKLVQKFVEEYKLDGFKEDFSKINSALLAIILYINTKILMNLLQYAGIVPEYL